MTAAEFKKAVDLTPWDLGTACGSCHVGGGFVEKDRNGRRFSSLQALQAAGMGAAMGNYDPYLFYVQDQYDPATGAANHVVKQAPWAFPYFNNFDPTQPVIVDPALVGPGGGGWGQASWGGGTQDNQLVMPNVKEMDCLFCHFTGYNNLMSSVMVQSGMNFFAPSIGADIIDRNSLSPTYQGYNAAFVNFSTSGAGRNVVSLNDSALAKFNAKPALNNCKQCHNVTGLKDIPDMMRDFLSAAPMAYTGNPSKSPFTGLEMPSFDFNAPFGSYWNWTGGGYATSPVLSRFDIFSALGYLPPAYTPDPAKAYAFIPSIGFPAAMGPTKYNSLISYAPGTNELDPMAMGSQVGGGNPAGTGPLYFEKDNASSVNGMDQNALKRGTVPFGRADWFKRGDVFGDNATEVHNGLGCAGCHMDTKTTKTDNFTPGSEFDGKSLCDPGRGYDAASLTETPSAETARVKGTTTDSRNTVKRCENCHVTRKNSDGVAIEYFGAPDPTAKHTAYGLLNGAAGFGVKAVRIKDATGAEEGFVGNHLDVVECAVCHTYKKSMVVRMLDSVSGNRYPGMFATNKQAGMMGMFSNPMPGMVNQYDEWTPLFTWQKIGNGDKTIGTGASKVANPDWRRKIYPVNIIFASVWNNENPSEDHNGDLVNGREANRTGVTAATPFNVAMNYDPPIARNMKAGMNFGASGFTPIPVGFGTDEYSSAYNEGTCNTFSGKFQYVGLYGGNVHLTTPQEIAAYKQYRTDNKAVLDGMDWSGVKLLYLGGPYMITHNVFPTSKWVKGKSCGDCHDSGKEFFTDGFNTTGLAIKATTGGAFMQSQAEILKVVANAGDLETGAELATKSGAAREIPFEELGTWNNTTKVFTPSGDNTGAHKRITDLNRGQALYPDQVVYTGADGTAYPTREAWISHLSSIGAAPSAQVGTIGGSTPLPGAIPGVTGLGVTINASSMTPVNNIQFVAGGVSNPNFTYTWTFSDLALTDPVTGVSNAKTGSTVTRIITAAKSFYANLVVKNNSTGVTTTSKVWVKVTATGPGASVIGTILKDGTGGITLPVTVAAPHTRIYIKWGDGTEQSVMDSAAATLNLTHKYYGATSGQAFSTGSVRVLNGGTVVGTQNLTVTPIP